MNPAAILSLLSELYVRIDQLTQENAVLKASQKGAEE